MTTRGLINSANNCYCNALLQVLTHMPFFLLYTERIAAASDSSLLKELTHISKQLKERTAYPVDPETFLRQLSTINYCFGDGTQQDSIELFVYLMATIESESAVVKRASMQIGGLLAPFLSTNQGLTSINPFEFSIASTLKCERCGYRRPVSHQTLHSISLSIPTHHQGLYDTKAVCVSLEDCLKAYFAQEQLDQVNCSQCSLSCYKAGLSSAASSAGLDRFYTNDDRLFDALGPQFTAKQSTVKQLSVSRFPNALCLHVNRKVYDMASGNMLKTSEHVAFPLLLDMSQYFTFENAVCTSFQYELSAVIVHIGNANAGHYISYTHPRPGEWTRCSDREVQRVSEKEVLGSQGYMLFYKRLFL